MHVPIGHSFPDATGVAFALGLGPPSLLAAIFLYFYYFYFSLFSYFLLLFLFLSSCYHLSLFIVILLFKGLNKIKD